jgi:hypothetical protein
MRSLLTRLQRALALDEDDARSLSLALGACSRPGSIWNGGGPLEPRQATRPPDRRGGAGAPHAAPLASEGEALEAPL